jgi:hypothetical protein
MEKLELKHLAPYFPYNLKLMYNGRIISIDAIGENYILIDESFQENTRFQYIKPILRPISHLNEDNASFLSSEAYLLVLEDSLRLNNMSYLDFEKLIENHYDVFGLIDKGLAISKPFSEL